ncbi:MAG TPA: hypothetical protein VF042_16635 [Gemmatimonadaceae bacterium]
MYRKVLWILAVTAAAACRPSSEAVQPMNHDMHDMSALRDPSFEKSPEVQSGLAQIRQVTATFHDLDSATAAGYTAWSPNPAVETCPANTQGKMGYHRVNVPLRGGAANPAAGDAVIDLERPEMLLYEKMANGKMRLVGVEYIVFKAAWERVNGVGAPPPEILGQPLLFSSHTFPGGTGNIDHYELHVWVWSPNPLGMFYPWNPNISC